MASMPRPVSASNCSGLDNIICRPLANFTTASPSGCSLPRSALAANRNMSISSNPSTVITLVTVGSPRVMVPVLSSVIVWSRCAFSNASLFLNNTPISAPLPVPTITAVGVANPSAQGHAITSTAIVLSIAVVNETCPMISQPNSVSKAKTRTMGTNIPDT